MPTANEEALDASVRHQIGLLRYSSSVVRKVVSLLNKVDDRLVNEIAKRGVGDQGFTQRRLELLLDSVRAIIAEAYGKATTALNDELKDLSNYERDFQLDLFRKVVPVNINYIKPTSAQLYAAVAARPFNGLLLRDWYKDLEAGAYRRLRDAIRMGYVEGRTTDQIVRDIRGTRAQRYKDGILEISRRGAEATVRTAINHTASVARNETYKANADVVKGVQWVSTLDMRTTAVCRGRDGKVYPLDSGPRPPAHINCRSSTAPVLKSWKEMGINLKEAPEGTRASLDGQVPASMTYSDWLRKQSKEVQDDVLGVEKAKLFRKGGLELDRFVDSKGHEYTLDQLRQRESKAWGKAFGREAPEPKPVPKPKRTAIEGRNEFERTYAARLGKDLDERYVRAFEKTTPVKLENSESGGFYRFSDHGMVIPADWQKAEARAKWVGTFAHEYGHAIDADGRDVMTLRSVAMADAIADDRGALLAREVKGSEPPAGARTHLQDMTGGNAEAVAEFGRRMQAGEFDRAMDGLAAEMQRRYRESGYVLTDDLRLDLYALGNIKDFLGAVTDLHLGAGHSKGYYGRFPAYREDDGRGGKVTAGHTAEAFANAFMANILEKHALWSYMIDQMGPRTAKAFRAIIDEVANG